MNRVIRRDYYKSLLIEKPFIKKAAHKLLVPVVFSFAICYTIGVYTTRERK